MARDHRRIGSGRPAAAVPSTRIARGEGGRFDEAVAAGTQDISKGGGRVAAVMRSAADEGLTVAKDGRIAGRVSAELIAAAKARTGLQSDTELVEFALANVALADDFAQVFRAVKGSVDPDFDLGV